MLVVPEGGEAAGGAPAGGSGSGVLEVALSQPVRITNNSAAEITGTIALRNGKEFKFIGILISFRRVGLTLLDDSTIRWNGQSES